MMVRLLMFLLCLCGAISAQAAYPDKPIKIVVGFAAETENLIANARGKLLRKGCDLIVANDVSEGSNVFGGEKNQVNIVTQHTVESWPKQDKPLVAVKLIDRIVSEMSKSR